MLFLLVNFLNDFNCSVDLGIFPDNLKLADLLPSFKAGNRTYLGNYRPISILPALSKIFQHVLLKQMENFVESILSKFQCGFRKGFSAQLSASDNRKNENVYR